MDKRTTVNVVTLGCSKNLVDSEYLLKMLADAGCRTLVEAEAKQLPKDTVVIVNTCGFIADAKEESINTLLAWGDLRKKGRISTLIAMGCLSERYAKELPELVPEVDKWFGKTDWSGIVEYLVKRRPATAAYDRIITTPRHHAYLKIAEGCDRFCAFCAIPLITGRYRSRKIEDIIDEAKRLVARGVYELNVIAQDLSAYGKDIYGKSKLAELVDRLADIEGLRWIRLHYAYPAGFPKDLLEVMARRSNVCKYLDIALQHISDPVLSNMRRHISGKETKELLAEIRQKVPGIHIRTTLMVGFPGEGEKEFNELLEFVKEQKFERMGAFAYCEEDDTFAAKHLKDEISDDVKQKRLSTLMALQEEISESIQQKKVGTKMNVVVDREEPDYYICRSEFDSPEVDPEVLVEKGRKLKRGDFVSVKITSAQPFELYAEIEE